MPKKKKPTPTVLHTTVYQTNPLIQARKHFNIIQSRLFYIGLMGVKPRLSDKDKFYDIEFPHTFVPTAEVVELLGHNHKYLNDLKRECAQLFDTHITLDYRDGGWKLMHLFELIEYVSEEGLHLRFDEKMKPYILDLFNSHGYTILNIEPIFKLSSPYAIRLLELLMQYRNMHGKIIHRSFTEEQLRFALNVPYGAYEGRMNNFLAKVLNSPVREVNLRTDFKMDYQIERVGRRISKFIFSLDISKIPDSYFDSRLCPPSTDEKISESVASELLKLGFSSASTYHMIRECGSDAECALRLQYAIKALARYKLTHRVDNELGFIRFAVEDNWRAKKLLQEQEKSAEYREKLLREEMRLEAEECGVDLSELLPGETILLSKYAKKMLRELKKDGQLSIFSRELLDLSGWSYDRFKQVYLKN